MNNYLIEMKDINKSFSSVKVLEDVNFNVKPGEVHVLLGENGAGKSTLIKIMSGAYIKTSGKILINGKEVDIDKPTDGFKHGIGVIYQEFNLNPYMPIYENIFLGKEYVKKMGILDRKKAMKETKKICKKVGLNIPVTTLIKDLSVAQKQMVEIAKAISMNVKILVLDEPTAALTDTEIKKLFSIIRELKSNGVGLVYISHRMEELKEIGDRCTVLRDGNYIGTVDLDEVTEDDLIKMMVGRKVDFDKRSSNYIVDDKTLEVKDLCYESVLKDVNFSLRKGEILGVAGLVGSGRTELAKCIIGEYPKTKGEVVVCGDKKDIKSPCCAISNGIVYLSEDRKSEGLILKHDVKENMTLVALDRIKNKFLLNHKKEKKKVENLVKQFNVKTHSINTKVKNLSGGNQQKVVIAKWVFCGADVYIIDEPTRGIDVGARQEIYNIMEELLKTGASIIMISSDLVEVLKMSDRILVMSQGSVSTILKNDGKVKQEDILKHAIGGES